jgi:hypothetical protein
MTETKHRTRPNAARTDAWKARHNARKQEKRRLLSGSRPFVACDGEGITNRKTGRHEYRLLVIGAKALHTGRELTSIECLDFICSAAPGTDAALLTSFSFGYDVSMILRDLPAERLVRVLADHAYDPETPNGESRYTYWNGYAIDYLPRNYFRVARTKPALSSDGAYYPRIVKGSARTVYDCFGLFQSSFSAATTDWKIGRARERDEIARMKDARSEFRRITKAVIRYCLLECRLLSELMAACRAVCQDVGIVPRTWNGAGKLAQALHDEHATLRRRPSRSDPGALCLEAITPPPVLGMARAAYYGGRFEIAATGSLPACHEADINSAYPAAMLELPCLTCGWWRRASASELPALEASGAVFVASLAFSHGADAATIQGGRLHLCGLPTRTKQGRLVWPASGSGVYWSPEIRSARLLGAEIAYKGAAWVFEPGCDHQPFAWVSGLYETRLVLGKTTRGNMLKLAINSLYGKLAQRIGAAGYSNPVWAGLITALTRATLNRAIALDPASIVMVATDALISLRPLPLAFGRGLGQWDQTQHERLFIVQPGLYWGPPSVDSGGKRKLKRRGVPLKFFEAIDPGTGERRTEKFERHWREYAERCRSAAPGGFVTPPKVPLPMTSFVGLRLAAARTRGKPSEERDAALKALACQWITSDRGISFDWSEKRGGKIVWTGEAAFHWPLPGPIASLAYTSEGALTESFDLDRLELDDQPDPVDLGIPWKN